MPVFDHSDVGAVKAGLAPTTPSAEAASTPPQAGGEPFFL